MHHLTTEQQKRAQIINMIGALCVGITLIGLGIALFCAIWNNLMMQPAEFIALLCMSVFLIVVGAIIGSAAIAYFLQK